MDGIVFRHENHSHTYHLKICYPIPNTTHTLSIADRHLWAVSAQQQQQQQQQAQQQQQQQQQRPPQQQQPQQVLAAQILQTTQRLQQAGHNQQQIQQQLIQQTGLTPQQLQQFRLQQQRNALMAQGNLTPQQQQQLLLIQRAQQKANEQIARNESNVPISNISAMNNMAFSNQQLGSMAPSNSPPVSMANTGLPRKHFNGFLFSFTIVP